MFDSDVIKKGINDQAVLQAMRDVDRRKFVSDKFSDVAYDDRALPIGEEQTISQPFIVAFMTENLQIEKGNKVLEVGTGSGFQTAVLSKLGAKVSTIEINKKLFKQNKLILKERYHNDGIFFDLNSPESFDEFFDGPPSCRSTCCDGACRSIS